MRKLDPQETKIVRQLIRNPRISDNQISKNTLIPVMTVNRKRKLLEKEGIIGYHTIVYHGDSSTKEYRAKQLYTIQFRTGITKEDYLNAIKSSKKFMEFNAKYHSDSFLGEKDGHLAVVIILEADSHAELMEIFNGEVIQNIKKRHGEDCIDKTYTVKLYQPIRLHHNYLPAFNMENGIIRKDWPDELVYVQ